LPCLIKKTSRSIWFVPPSGGFFSEFSSYCSFRRMNGRINLEKNTGFVKVFASKRLKNRYKSQKRTQIHPILIKNVNNCLQNSLS